MLDIPLTLLRCENIIMTLGIDETMQPVLPGEAIGDAGSMLPGTASQISRGTDIQCFADLS